MASSFIIYRPFSVFIHLYRSLGIFSHLVSILVKCPAGNVLFPLHSIKWKFYSNNNFKHLPTEAIAFHKGQVCKSERVCTRAGKHTHVHACRGPNESSTHVPYDDEDESSAEHQGEHVTESGEGERHGDALPLPGAAASLSAPPVRLLPPLALCSSWRFCLFTTRRLAERKRETKE